MTEREQTQQKINSWIFHHMDDKKQKEKEKVSKSQHKQNVIKLLVVGDHNTGKTSLVRRYIYKEFNEWIVEPTIGMDIASKYVHVDDMRVKVQCWDIAGTDSFIGLAPTY